MTREIETWLSTAGANGSVVHELTVILLFGVYQVVWKRAGAELSMGWVDPWVGLGWVKQNGPMDNSGLARCTDAIGGQPWINCRRNGGIRRTPAAD